MLRIKILHDVIYYTDEPTPKPPVGGGRVARNKEAEAVWWSRNNRLVQDGAVASRTQVIRLAEGLNPKTGRQIVSGQGDKRRAGYDLLFSPPKSWTATWVVSDERGKCILEQMLRDSVRECLDRLLKQSLIEVRIGKGGKKRKPAAGLMAALYTHVSNRDGDPLVHVHAVLLNVAVRLDGQVRAISNEKLCEVHKVIGALFRLKLAERLEAQGVSVRADVFAGFVINGQPYAMADTWSKRSDKILRVVDELGLSGTAGHMRKVDRISRSTRKQKDTIPERSVLDVRWRGEALAAGWKPGDEWCRLDRPPIIRHVDEEAKEARRIIEEAVNLITETQSLFHEHEVEALALTLAVGRANEREIVAAMREVLSASSIIHLQKKGWLTTSHVALEEAEIVRVAVSGLEKPGMGFGSSVGATLRGDHALNDGQRDAIRHVLSPNGVSAVEGGLALGSTEVARTLQAACRQEGRRLILVAQVGTKVQSLKHALKHTGPATVLDGLLEGLRAGTFRLGAGDVVLVDEAAHSARPQMRDLLREAKKAGAKLVLFDDTRQSVAMKRSDPFSLISRAIGTQRILALRRQEIEWQRQASVWARGGRVGRALAAYWQYGAVQVLSGQKQTLDMLAHVFREVGGDGVAIAANNKMVADINPVLRLAERVMGVIGIDELKTRAVPRGKDGKGKAVDLALAAGDRLILGGEAVIDGVTLGSGVLLSVSGISTDTGKIRLETDEGQVLVTSAAALSKAGKKGKAPILQHAYCVTPGAARAAGWKHVLWLASQEDAASAFKAMTCHRDSLKIFIDRSDLPRMVRAAATVEKPIDKGKRGAILEPTDEEIISLVGLSMERTEDPRNVTDVVGGEGLDQLLKFVPKSERTDMAQHGEELGTAIWSAN